MIGSRLAHPIERTTVVTKAWEQVVSVGQRAFWEPTLQVTGAGPIGPLAAPLGKQHGLDVHVLDLANSGPKPELVRALGATYQTGSIAKARLRARRHYRMHRSWEGNQRLYRRSSTCFSLYDLHQARLALDAAQREFVRRAGPWARLREPRQKKAASTTEAPPYKLEFRRPKEPAFVALLLLAYLDKSSVFAAENLDLQVLSLDT